MKEITPYKPLRPTLKMSHKRFQHNEP